MDAMTLVVCTYYVDLQVMACKGKWQVGWIYTSISDHKDLLLYVCNLKFVSRLTPNVKVKEPYNWIIENLLLLYGNNYDDLYYCCEG